MRLVARMRFASAMALALVLAAGAARGQTAAQAQPTREQLSPTNQTGVVHHRARDLFAEPEPEKCALPDDPALRFRLRSVEVVGAPSLSEAARKSVWADMDGADITPAGLCEIRDRLGARLFRRGILAQVLIPPQHIQDGHVIFRVIEAQIVTVRVHGDVGPAQAMVEAYLDHLRGLAPFDLDTAQRYLLLVDDLPGILSSVRLTHSTASGAPAGGLDLDVTLEPRKAYDLIGAVANTSSAALGPWSGVASVNLNSATRFGERTTLLAYSTLGNASHRVVQLVEQGRLGDQGMFAQASLAYGSALPGGALKSLKLRGDSTIVSVEVDDPVVRLKRANLTLAGGVDLVDQRTAFPGGGLLADDHLRIAWARADAQASHVFDRRPLETLSAIDADISVQVRKGLRGWGASAPGAVNLSRADGRSDAFIVRAEGHGDLYAAAFRGVGLNLGLHFVGEWSDRPLLGYEQQAIGNLTIGQGYDPGAASGDRVAAAELRLSVGPLKAGPRITFRPYVFYDAAYAGALARGAASVTLRSTGGGVEVRLPYGVRMDLAYAQPLDRPVASAASKPPSRILFRLVVVQ